VGGTRRWCEVTLEGSSGRLKSQKPKHQTNGQVAHDALEGSSLLHDTGRKQLAELCLRSLSAGTAHNVLLLQGSGRAG
jgi:hypothetical protein